MGGGCVHGSRDVGRVYDMDSMDVGNARGMYLLDADAAGQRAAGGGLEGNTLATAVFALAEDLGGEGLVLLPLATCRQGELASSPVRMRGPSAERVHAPSLMIFSKSDAVLPMVSVDWGPKRAWCRGEVGNNK